MMTAIEPIKNIQRVTLEKGEGDLPIISLTFRGQVTDEHTLTSLLEMADGCRIERVDELRVRVVFTASNEKSVKAMNLSTATREDLLTLAAELGVEDVNPATHISTLRKKVAQAKADR